MSRKAVRIESPGGKGYDVKVTDMETGEMIPNVAAVTIAPIVPTHIVQATLTIHMPVIDIIADASIKHVCPCCGREVKETQA